MLKALLGNPLLLFFAILSLAGAVAGYTAWIYQKGVLSERTACEAEKAAAIKAAEEINQSIRNRKREVRHENQSLERDGIVRKLCANGWVRNPSHCPAD